MSIGSVMTNTSAAIALQSLSSTTRDLESTQRRISTGLRVADSRDDTGAFSVAQRVRGDIAGINGANDQLGAARGVLQATMSGLKNISDSLGKAQTLLNNLTRDTVSVEQRQNYLNEYNAVRQRIANFVNDSNYNGRSVLGTSAIGRVAGTQPTHGGALVASRNETGGTITISGSALVNHTITLVIPPAKVGDPVREEASTIQIHAFDLLDISGSTGVRGANAAQIADYISTEARPPLAEGATPPPRRFIDVESAVNTAMARFGSALNEIDAQMEFNSEKISALESGVGSMVDADLAKESARLQSLQVRQQLGVTALTAANAAPQVLLSLFR